MGRITRCAGILAVAGISAPGGLLRARLDELASKIRTGGYVRAGFLEGATYPDGTPVATVAAVQNFGSPAQGIPPRPFFTNAIRQYSPEWGAKLGKVLAANDWDTERSLELLGEIMVGDIKQSIVDTNEPPLAEKTIERKGFEKPLIDTSHMINSVSAEVTTDG